MAQLAFDHVSIKKSSGFNMSTAQEFLELPLGERINLVLDSKVQFLRGSEIVPAIEALGSLREKYAEELDSRL